MTTPSPSAFRDLLGDVLEVVLNLGEDYETAYRLGYGARRGGGARGRRSGTSDPTAAIAAVGSRARGACRRSERLVRASIREREEDEHGRVVRAGGPLHEALLTLGAVLGAEQAKTTDVPQAEQTETAESLQERRRIRRRRGRDPNPLTREQRWGDA